MLMGASMQASRKMMKQEHHALRSAVRKRPLAAALLVTVALACLPHSAQAFNFDDLEKVEKVERGEREMQRKKQRWAKEAEESELAKSRQGQNRIRSRDGNVVIGTCASGHDFVASLGSDNRWMTGGGRNGMQFASSLDEAISKVCN